MMTNCYSGAGKSTLLNILTQKKMQGVRFSGDVAINETLVEQGDMKKLSAYVQQEDIFISEATVEEQLMFTARLRMRAKKTSKERKEIVSEVIEVMGLTPCRKTRIGSSVAKSLSRGERKRLAFATELLSNPWILFCDEPTSGLDSFMALQVVQALK
ncbi:ABC transporter, ATP-binding protein [Cooperia oncophora]